MPPMNSVCIALSEGSWLCAVLSGISAPPWIFCALALAYGASMAVLVVHKPKGGGPRRIVSIDKVDEERKHLETLFQERINFYLVYASVAVMGVANISDETIRVLALWMTLIISVVMSLSLVRTFLLVRMALDDITNRGYLPYSDYHRAIKFPGNANYFLVVVPILITFFFFVMAAFLPCGDCFASLRMATHFHFMK